MEKRIARLVEDAISRVEEADTYEQFSEVFWTFLQETRRVVDAEGPSRSLSIEREVFDLVLRKSVPRGLYA